MYLQLDSLSGGQRKEFTSLSQETYVFDITCYGTREGQGGVAKDADASCMIRLKCFHPVDDILSRSPVSNTRRVTSTIGGETCT